MKKEIAKKWINALRSGKYKQGQNFLKQYDTKNQPRHCCLGVLCELYNDSMKKNHKKTITTKTFDDGLFSNGCVKFGGKEDFLPISVRKWAGMKSKDGKLDNHLFYNSLADMNDFGKTFKTISNTIEKNIENL